MQNTIPSIVNPLINLYNGFTLLADGISLNLSELKFVESINVLISNISNFTTNIISSITNASQNIIDSISPMFTVISDAINMFKDFFVSMISTIINFLNPYSEDFILLPIIDLFLNALRYLNPLSPDNMIYVLFQPSPEFLQGYVQDHFTQIKEKIWVVQIFDGVFDGVKSLTQNNVPPVFKFNIAYKGFNQEVVLFDMAPYNEYRSYIHNFIAMIAWFYFIKKTYRRIPNIIRGGASA